MENILLLIIFRLMAIFQRVIGGESFGERDFVANYIQIDDNISVSDW